MINIRKFLITMLKGISPGIKNGLDSHYLCNFGMLLTLSEPQ